MNFLISCLEFIREAFKDLSDLIEVSELGNLGELLLAESLLENIAEAWATQENDFLDAYTLDHVHDDALDNWALACEQESALAVMNKLLKNIHQYHLNLLDLQLWMRRIFEQRN